MKDAGQWTEVLFKEYPIDPTRAEALILKIQIEAFNEAIELAATTAYKDIRRFRKMYTDLQYALKKNQMPSAKTFKCDFILKLKL